MIFPKMNMQLYFPLNFLFVHSSFLPDIACLRMRYTTCIYQLQRNHISAQSTFCALISQYDPKSSGVEIDHTHIHSQTGGSLQLTLSFIIYINLIFPKSFCEQ